MDQFHVREIKSFKNKKLSKHHHTFTYLRSLFFYSLLAITFTIVLICSIFILPSLKTFIFTSLPNLFSIFLAPTSLFLLGNIIVAFLVRGFKIQHTTPSSLSSQTTTVYTFSDHVLTPKMDSDDWNEERDCVNVVDYDEKMVGEDLRSRADTFIAKFVAYEYARRGACLALAARRERGLREVADRCREIGSPDALIIAADVAKDEDCRKMVDSTITHFGRLDHLVNNAGVTSVCSVEECEDITNLRPIMDINFWGAVYTTRYAIPHLRNSRGRIVVLSSVDSWLPLPRQSFYNASKAALHSMFETVRIEVWPDIKVTIVTPGPIESELTKGKMLSKEGDVKVDQEMRDVQIGMQPIENMAVCAREIVKGACRGDRCVIVPSWYRVTHWLMMFCPEVVEWCYWFLYMTKPHARPIEAWTKKLLDVTGARAMLYPSSIRSPDVKTQ